jgi:hypothetical protein
MLVALILVTYTFTTLGRGKQKPPRFEKNKKTTKTQVLLEVPHGIDVQTTE